MRYLSTVIYIWLFDFYRKKKRVIAFLSQFAMTFSVYKLVMVIYSTIQPSIVTLAR